MKSLIKKLLREHLDDEESVHEGPWFHGGKPSSRTDLGNFLYVSDDLKEAKAYAERRNGGIYKLKEKYTYIVSWAIGHSEGMIKQTDINNLGGFDMVFELFIKV